MAFCEHLSEINSYLCLMYWEERTLMIWSASTTLMLLKKCSNTVTALHVSAKMLTRAMQKNKHSFPGNRDV